MSDMDARIAAVGDVFFELGGGMLSGAFGHGLFIGMKLALEHPEAAAGALNVFFETPHTDEDSEMFYVDYDYIAEGKMPA